MLSHTSALILSRFIVMRGCPTSCRLGHQGVCRPSLVVAVVCGCPARNLQEVSTISSRAGHLSLDGEFGYGRDWSASSSPYGHHRQSPRSADVFVIQAQNPDIPASKIYRGTLPFLGADFVLVALLIAFPSLALWLPAALRM